MILKFHTYKKLVTRSRKRRWSLELDELASGTSHYYHSSSW